MLRSKECNGGPKYDDLTNIFRPTLDNHAPLKQKQVRGNQAPFMTKEMSKAVITRSRFKSKYNKWPSRANLLALKQIKNKCTNLIKTAKKQYFTKSAENRPLTNTSFWNSISLFLTNKNVRNDNVITLNEKGQLTNDELDVAETLNSHYINNVNTTCGQPSQALDNPKDQANDIASVDTIINNYKNHPSINRITKECSNPKIYSFPEAKKEEINILIKRLNPKKATGPDGIPLKIIKLSADVIDKHLNNIINTDLESSCFSENAKIASVKPIYKKESRSDKNNYRPVSILNSFSKIYERFINDKLLSHVNDTLSDFVSAYRSKYSSNHVIFRLIEE